MGQFHFIHFHGSGPLQYYLQFLGRAVSDYIQSRSDQPLHSSFYQVEYHTGPYLNILHYFKALSQENISFQTFSAVNRVWFGAWRSIWRFCQYEWKIQNRKWFHFLRLIFCVLQTLNALVYIVVCSQQRSKISGLPFCPGFS